MRGPPDFTLCASNRLLWHVVAGQTLEGKAFCIAGGRTHRPSEPTLPDVLQNYRLVCPQDRKHSDPPERAWPA